MFFIAAKLWHFIKLARKKSNKSSILFNKGKSPEDYASDNVIGEMSQIKLQELLKFDFENLQLPQTTSTYPTNLDRVVLVPYTRYLKCNNAILF